MLKTVFFLNCETVLTTFKLWFWSPKSAWILFLDVWAVWPRECMPGGGGVGGCCIKEQASSLFPELISRWFWMFCQQHACLIWAHMHFLHEFSCMSLGQLVSVHFNVPVRATPPPHHRLSAGQQFYRWSDMSFYFCILQAASDVTQFPSSILGHDEIFVLCKHVCVWGGGHVGVCWGERMWGIQPAVLLQFTGLKFQMKTTYRFILFITPL